jgi:hypothetical protein
LGNVADRESSLLFSLESLLAHEQQKVDREREDAERRRRAELEAREAAESARLAEQNRLARAERERAEAEERRRLEEQARLDGIKQAELERARLETRLKSESELALRQERHALELRAATAASRATAARGLLIGSVSLAVLATLAALALELFVHRPELARVTQSSSAALATEAARVAEVRALLADSERRRNELIAELSRKKLAEESVAPTLPHTRPTPARPARPGPVAPASKPCVGDPHDPLNPCLGG